MPALLPALILGVLACRPGASGEGDGGGEDGGAGDGGGATEGTRHGLLQFHLRHNLDDDACLATGDCFLEIEETEDVAGWIDSLAADVDSPVLHWDRGIPWSAFAEAPPPGEDPVAFHEARMDPALVAWIHAWRDAFAEAGQGYLALSMLDGTRDRLAPELMPDGSLVAVGGTCPELGPGATFTAEDGSPFVLGEAWARWARFLVAEVQPDQLALQVEVNLFETTCPDQWPSLVALYHDTWDQLRPELGAEVQLFATLSLPPLLGYDPACQADLSFVPCDQEPPAPPEVDAAACFPGDPRALEDLAAGGRMDMLALSFYPDGLGMALPGEDDARVRAWFEGTDPTGTCDAWARLPAWVDPLPTVQALGWDGPVGFAETSARSCDTLQWWDDGTTAAAVALPGSEAGQVGWMELVLAQDLAFVHHSFPRDYAPLGLWTVEEGVLDATIFNLFQMWPCSGLRDEDGAPKAALAPWQAALGG